MSVRADVTYWCRLDVLEVIRGFIRERGGLPVTPTEEGELTERLCERISLEVGMHLDRQAWLLTQGVGTLPRFGGGSDPPEAVDECHDGLPY